MNQIKALCLGALAIVMFAGCLTSKVSTVTPGGTNDQGVVFAPYTNTVTVVNTNNLMLDCSVLTLMGTPAVTYVLANDKSGNARAIVTDIQTALNGALNGADTNVTDTITGFISKDPAVKAQFTPLIQAASALRGQLLDKYGSTVSVQITTAILKTDLNIVNSALAAVPAK